MMLPVAFSFAVFVAGASLTGIVLCVIWGFLTPGIANMSLWVGAAAGGFCYLRSSELAAEDVPRKSSALEMTFAVIFLLLSMRYFLWFYYGANGKWFSSEVAETTLPVFLSKVLLFSEGLRFWPENPLFIAERFYDFGFILFAAMIRATGAPLTALLPLAGMISAVSLLVLLCRWGRIWGIAVFLFLGGTAGWILIAGNYQHWLREWMSQQVLLFSSLPFMLYVSRPEYLYIFPAGVMLLLAWKRRLFENSRIAPVWVEVLIWGTFPVFNLHGFFLLTLLFLFWVIVKQKWNEFGGVFCKAMPVAVPLVLICAGTFENLREFLKVFPSGWSKEPDLLRLIAQNFGHVILVMALGAVLGLGKRKYGAFAAFFMPAAALTGFVIFADISARSGSAIPFAAWSFLLFGCYLNEIFSSQDRKVFLQVLGILIVAGPGLYAHIKSEGYYRNQAALASTEVSDEICKKLEKLPRRWRFATSMERDHPVALCGFQIVSAFNDTTFQEYSIYRETCAKLRRLLAGGDDWLSLARELNVRYLFWGDTEKKNFDYYSKKPWVHTAKKIRDEKWGEVYDLGTPETLGSLPKSGEGLTLSLYATSDWTGEPLRSETIGSIDLFWPESERDLLATPFTMLFQGDIHIPEEGEIQFYLASDDGSDLTIDGQLVIDHLADHPFRIKGGRFTAARSGWHPVQVRFHNSWGVARIRLWWKLPSGREEVIPGVSFRPVQPAEHSSES